MTVVLLLVLVALTCSALAAGGFALGIWVGRAKSPSPDVMPCATERRRVILNAASGMPKVVRVDPGCL